MIGRLRLGGAEVARPAAAPAKPAAAKADLGARAAVDQQSFPQSEAKPPARPEPPKRYAKRALAALELAQPLKKAHRPPEAELRQWVTRFDDLARSARAFSPEEIRRAVAPELPAPTLAQHIRPLMRNDRAIDRFGPEPWFLFATHLAHYMLRVKPGTTEQQALQELLDSNPMYRLAHPNAHTLNVELLRRMYPFVPSWPDGVKSAQSVHHPSDDENLPLETRVWVRELKAKLSTYAKIPVMSKEAWAVAQRREPYMLEGMQIREVASGLSDNIAALHLRILYDGIKGEDMWRVTKDYSSPEPAVLDVMRRVFGMRLARVDGSVSAASDALKAMMEETVKDAATQPLRPTIVYGIGVRAYGWLGDLKRRFPEWMLGVLKHTTYDMREGTEAEHAAYPLPAVHMPSASKTNDEAQRFERADYPLINEIGVALQEPVLDSRFLVLGLGDVIGKPMTRSLLDNKRDVGVYDIDPQKLVEADGEGFEVVKLSDEELSRRLFIIGASGEQSVGPELIDRIVAAQIRAHFSPEVDYPDGREPTVYLLSKSTGYHEFDLKHLEGIAEKVEPGKDFHGKPVTTYTVRDGEGSMKFTVIADGAPANLTVADPVPLSYSSMSIIQEGEALRELALRMKHNDNGDKPPASYSLEFAPGSKKTRVFHLFPRNLIKPRVEYRPEARGWKAHPDAYLMIQDWTLAGKLDDTIELQPAAAEEEERERQNDGLGFSARPRGKRDSYLIYAKPSAEAGTFERAIEAIADDVMMELKFDGVDERLTRKP